MQNHLSRKKLETKKQFRFRKRETVRERLGQLVPRSVLLGCARTLLLFWKADQSVNYMCVTLKVDGTWIELH